MMTATTIAAMSHPRIAGTLMLASMKPAKPAKAPRAGKGTEIIALLEESVDGITAGYLAELTGWQPHTLRAFLSGLRKKGHQVISDRHRELGTTYRIAKEG
jgi:hypothetical protein